MKRQVLIDKEALDDIKISLQWVQEKADFECDCDPAYESDTNYWNHKDTCSVFMEDHISITFVKVTEILGEAARNPRPRIVCLCGSTRFWRTFQEAGLRETMAGRIVLSIGAASGTDDQHFGNLPKEEYDRVKEMLDQLHFRKIELADQVLILDVDGYVGPSTSRELAYARKLGKVVRFWEQEAATRTGGG